MSEEKSALNWQRLSPVAVIFYIFKVAKEIFSNAWQSLAPLAIVILNADNKGRMILLVIVGILLLLVITSLLQYWFFRYCLTEQEILINQGVFKKQKRIIGFERVQNININQPIYFKPFNLVSMAVDTAGSSSDEGTLAGISNAQADSIRDIVLKHQSAPPTTTEQSLQQDEPLPAEQILAQASTADIIRYGLSNNGAYIILAFMAPFYKQLQEAIKEYFSSGHFDFWFEWFSHKPTAMAVLGIVMVLSFILLMSTLSVIGALLRFHRYRLSINEQTLKRKSGLINTHEESLNLSKIQAICRSRNFIARWLNIENLVLRQASATGTNSSGQTVKSNLFVVPARTQSQTETLLKQLYPDYCQNLKTSPVSRRYIVKTSVVLLIITMLITAPFVYMGHYFLIVIWLWPLLALPLIYLRWRKYRYGFDGEYGLISTGLFGYKHVLFPVFKVQQVVITQAIWQKPKGLADLTIHMAGSSMTIPYMPIEHARQWFDNIYYKIESEQRPWY